MLVVKVTPRPYCGQGTRLDRTKGALVRDERGWLRVATHASLSAKEHKDDCEHTTKSSQGYDR
jgi:hypothetical protein